MNNNIAHELEPQPGYDDDDGLAPPPELPPFATSQTGAVEQAETLQHENNVPQRFRGAWYHETYDNVNALDNQHEYWTWFTRSPSGGTICGKTVLTAYVVDVPENSKLHPAQKGDKIGYEGKDALPDWWMTVGREDIPKLMVVSEPHEKHGDQLWKTVLESDSFKAIRQASISKLDAMKKQKQPGG